MPDTKEVSPLRVDLRIKSLDFSRSSLRLLELIEEHRGELQARLNTEFRNLDITDVKVAFDFSVQW